MFVVNFYLAILIYFYAYGVFHLVSNPAVSWFGFANKIFEQAAGYKLIDGIPVVNALATTEYPTSAKRPANSKLDTDFIGQFSSSDWVEELDGVLRFYREND